MPTLLEIVLSNALVATLLALLAAALAAVCRRPALTHRLWLLVLLKLITPPLVPVHLPWAVPAEPAVAAPAAPADGAGDVAPDEEPMAELEDALAEPDAAEAGPAAAEAVPAADPPGPAWVWGPWAGYLVPAWLLVALVWLAWNGLHLVRFGRCLRHAVPAPGWLQEEAHGLAGRLGLGRCPPVLLVPGAVPPMVWGGVRGLRLLFPAALLGRLDGEQRASLLLHELAHVRRRDHWVRWLELIVVPLYWWHPVVWWAKRELHEAEEQCCDAWVVWALPGPGRTYALALLQALAFCAKVRSPLPAAASGVGQVPHLRRRLTMIVQGKTPRALSRAGAFVVLGLGLLLLPLLPVAGQDPDPKPAPRGAQKDDPDPKAEQLRKAIRVLEEVQRLAPDDADKDKDDAEPRAKVEQLKKALKVLQQVQGIQHRVRVRVIDEEDAKATAGDLARLEKDVAQKRKELAEAEARLAKAKAQVREEERARRRSAAAEAANKSKTTTNPGGDRLGALEQRLDRVMQELESLRRDLRRERQMAPPKPPKPPAPPEP